MTDEKLPFMLTLSQISYILDLIRKDDTQKDLIDLFETGQKLMEVSL